MVCLESFGDSRSEVYSHIVKIDSNQLNRLNLSSTGSILATLLLPLTTLDTVVCQSSYVKIWMNVDEQRISEAYS